ncbi:caskin-1-like isoform X2 [Vidua macroura]|nr:caskin-1-like isoform X2 [Vidua macroura]
MEGARRDGMFAGGWRVRGGMECLLGDGGCAEGYAQGRLHRPPPPPRSPQRRGRPRGWGRAAGRSGGSPKSVRSPWEAMLEPQSRSPRTGAPGAAAAAAPTAAPVPHVLNCGGPPGATLSSPGFEASREPTAPELFPR